MKYVIVDTDVFSDLLRGIDADTSGQHLVGAVPTLSFATVAEVYAGAASAGWGERRGGTLEEAIRRYLVAPYDVELARLWGRLRAQARSIGHPLGQAHQCNDLWIAATAIYYDAPPVDAKWQTFLRLSGARPLAVGGSGAAAVAWRGNLPPGPGGVQQIWGRARPSGVRGLCLGARFTLRVEISCFTPLSVMWRVYADQRWGVYGR